MILSNIFVFIFFFKQKTAYEMRISDWSSDVCSSDLECDRIAQHDSDDGRQHDAVDLDRRLFDEMISLHNLPLPFQKLRPALRAEQAVRHQAILFLPRAHPAVGRDRKSTRLNSSH